MTERSLIESTNLSKEHHIPVPDYSVTKINLNHETNIDLLKQKLVEYSYLARPHVEATAAMNEIDRKQLEFTEAILRIIIDLAQEVGRDFAEYPVLLPEIAAQIDEIFGRDITRSTEVSFEYDEKSDTYHPDIKTLFQEAVLDELGGATYDDIAFSVAYGDVMAIVAGVTPEAEVEPELPDTSDPSHLPDVSDSSHLAV